MKSCIYCKQQTGHHETCINATDPDRDKPSQQLACKWVNHPSESVWREFRKDDLGNPVLSRIQATPGTDYIASLNSGSLIFPHKA
jgi:hypothetical protein